MRRFKTFVGLSAACLTVWLCTCATQNEKIVPELVLDVPDEIKPDIQNILVRVMAADFMPFEADLATEQEFVIPSGKQRTLFATVLDARGEVRATGTTVCNVTRNEKIITLNLFAPPAAPHLSAAVVSGRMCTLAWGRYQPTAGREFKCYRVYRAHFADVNEICELVKEIDGTGDTVYTDNGIDQFQDYYYRIYVFEKTGAFNGSNQVQATRSTTNDSTRT
jgi:hypothetical protein